MKEVLTNTSDHGIVVICLPNYKEVGNTIEQTWVVGAADIAATQLQLYIHILNILVVICKVQGDPLQNNSKKKFMHRTSWNFVIICKTGQENFFVRVIFFNLGLGFFDNFRNIQFLLVIFY